LLPELGTGMVVIDEVRKRKEAEAVVGYGEVDAKKK